jgi:hypothetical protein
MLNLFNKCFTFFDLKVLVISDSKNGTGKNFMIKYEKNINIYDLDIHDNDIYHEKKVLNFDKYDIIFFNFNEDFILFDDKILEIYKDHNNLERVYNNIYDRVRHKTVYNIPKKCYSIGNKIETYKKLTNITNEFISIPKFFQIKSINDLQFIKKYPVILKINKWSQHEHDIICNDDDELLNYYIENFKNNDFAKERGVMCVEYINNKIESLNTNNSIRMFVVNNVFIDYVARPSSSKLIHTKDIDITKLNSMDIYFERVIEKHMVEIQEFLNVLYMIYGKGQYAHDFVYCEKKDKLYLCELGLKGFDDTLYHKLMENNIEFTHNKLINKPKKFKKRVFEIMGI